MATDTDVRLASSTHPLVDRATRPGGTTVRIGNVLVGGPEFVVAAGPCAVEDEQQVTAAATAVAAAGARLLRGGAFKPRTSPYAFQGLGEEGLRLLAEAGRALGLPTVTEVVDAADVPLVARYADVLQVGARNTQNFALLKALGAAGRPVLLKRGMSTTIDELLMSAEYVLAHGNPDVTLCERGIRTFETATRNTLDLGAVAVLKARTHLPVLVDPSHATGCRDLVAPLARAAAAVGADGLLVEVHPDPDHALCDGPQSLTPDMFADLMRDLVGQCALVGRTLAALAPAAAVTAVAAPAVHAYRERIDAIDDVLVRLLQERAALGLRLGRIKAAAGAPVCVPEREREVISRAADSTDGPLTPAAVARVLRAVVAETRAAQAPGRGPVSLAG